MADRGSGAPNIYIDLRFDDWHNSDVVNWIAYPEEIFYGII
jgi:hypothetical protein